jgi:hypothetical protein
MKLYCDVCVKHEAHTAKLAVGEFDEMFPEEKCIPFVIGNIVPSELVSDDDTFELADGSYYHFEEYALLFDSIKYNYGGEGHSFRIPKMDGFSIKVRS